MKLATLLYITNSNGEYLLMRRRKDPNKGLLSPPGGKLHHDEAESPVQCAVREAEEECLMKTQPQDWKLAGIVTEKNFPGAGNIMIFLMRYKGLQNELPPPCSEGSFVFSGADGLDDGEIPVTDRKFIWQRILKNERDPFFLSIDCTGYPGIVLM